MKTLELTDEEFSELADLLQLMTVLNIQLYMRGKQPDRVRLSSIFDKICKATVAQAKQG